MSDPISLIHKRFIDSVNKQQFPLNTSDTRLSDAGLSADKLLEIYRSMITSRCLDLHSRVMQREGQSFYTIGSSGHEGNAAVAAASRVKDMAFLHYRSGAFFVQRSIQNQDKNTVRDMLLSFAASSDDPISGGRHKVLGSKELMVPPQTSTIASHLPKAVGAAFSIGIANHLKTEAELDADGVVICSFGDASANHSTAQGAINTACWTAYQNIPLPLVFVCEDNGIGISTATPKGWISANHKNKPGLEYFFCDGLNVLDAYATAQKAINFARKHRKPVFLHMRTVRLFGHAGSDAEFVYRSKKSIADTESQDPLLHGAKILIDEGIMSASEIVDCYNKIKANIENESVEVAKRPKLTSPQQVMESLIPPVRKDTTINKLSAKRRTEIFAHDKHNLSKPQHMAKLINWTLTELMAQRNNIIVCGEDVAEKGGVYSVTTKLVDNFSHARVINTPLDEQSILGLAIGLGHNGLLPIPEIQFLAYVHNAEDQIRGEAATLSFFSNGQFTNPMVIRVAGLAYQRGFGGHFHNDNSFAVFRDIPGVIIACPSNGQDAVEMMRSCVELAQKEQRVVIFLEPIALYMTKDLHQEGDGLWSFEYTHADARKALPKPGEFNQYGEGKDIAIISYGNGYYLSRKAEKILSEQGINCKLIDLRWLAPLNEQAIVDSLSANQKVLIVDECRRTGSISEGLVTAIHELAPGQHVVERITAEDSFIPLGSAAYEVLPSADAIIEKVQQMTKSD